MWRRAAGVIATAVDDDLFVVAPATQDIVHLDAMAAGLWRALEQPAAETELVALFQAAFPAADATQVAADVRRALDELAAAGLAVTAP